MGKGHTFTGTDQEHVVQIVNGNEVTTIVDGQDIGTFDTQEDALQAASDEVEEE